MCWYFQSWSVDFGKQNTCCASLSCTLRDHTSFAISAATTGLHRTRSRFVKMLLILWVRSSSFAGKNALQGDARGESSACRASPESADTRCWCRVPLSEHLSLPRHASSVGKRIIWRPFLFQVPFVLVEFRILLPFKIDPTNVQTSFDCNWSRNYLIYSSQSTINYL